MPPTIRGQTAGSSQYDGQGDPLSQPVPGSPRLARTRGLGGLVKLSLLLLGSSPLSLGHIFSGLLRVHLGPLRIRLGLTPVRRCQTEDLFEDVFAQSPITPAWDPRWPTVPIRPPPQIRWGFTHLGIGNQIVHRVIVHDTEITVPKRLSQSPRHLCLGFHDIGPHLFDSGLHLLFQSLSRKASFGSLGLRDALVRLSLIDLQFSTDIASDIHISDINRQNLKGCTRIRRCQDRGGNEVRVFQRILVIRTSPVVTMPTPQAIVVLRRRQAINMATVTRALKFDAVLHTAEMIVFRHLG